MGLLIQEDRSAIWKNNSASRLNAECLKALDYQYNKGLPRPPTREMDRGIITEEMAVAKHFGKDIAVVGEEKLQQLLRERPERSEHLEWYREQWPRWIAGVETYDSGYALWPVDPIQRKVTLTIEGTTPALIGYIDLVIDGQGKPIVADIKSKGQLSWGISQAWRRQLTIYCLAIKSEMKLDFIPKAKIHMISVGKTPGSRVIEVDITADDVSDLIDRANVLQFSIDNDYWPRNTTTDKCSERWCAFYGRCWSDHLIPLDESLSRFS